MLLFHITDGCNYEEVASKVSEGSKLNSQLFQGFPRASWTVCRISEIMEPPENNINACLCVHCMPRTQPNVSQLFPRPTLH